LPIFILVIESRGFITPNQHVEVLSYEKSPRANNNLGFELTTFCTVFPVLSEQPQSPAATIFVPVAASPFWKIAGVQITITSNNNENTDKNNFVLAL
jgi:hypothetical protein